MHGINNHFVQHTTSETVDTLPDLSIQGAQLRSGLLRVQLAHLTPVQQEWVRQHDYNRTQRIFLGPRVRYFTTVCKRTGQTNAATAVVIGFNKRAGRLTGIR